MQKEQPEEETPHQRQETIGRNARVAPEELFPTTKRRTKQRKQTHKDHDTKQREGR